jgi:hypothetical protein
MPSGLRVEQPVIVSWPGGQSGRLDLPSRVLSPTSSLAVDSVQGWVIS